MRRLRSMAIAAAVATTCGVVVAACSIYDSSLLSPGMEAGLPVVEAGTPADAGTADADTCMHFAPPLPPMKEDGNESLDIVFAGVDVRVSRSGAKTIPAPPTGYDLDGLCTCPGPEDCVALSGDKHCDGDGGADDAVGGLFDTFAKLVPALFQDDALAGSARAGNRTILFRIKGWNGGKDDTQVTFVVYGSNGLIDHLDPDGGGVLPKNDGTDVWTIDPASLLGGAGVDAGPTCEGNDSVCVPLFADTTAYVSGGVFVAHVDFPLAFGAGDSTLVIRLQHSMVTGTLTREADGGVHVDDGEIIGRWSTSALLTAIAAIPDPVVPGAHLCGDAGSYPSLKKIICSGADLAADPPQDGMKLPCSAISSAIGFSAVPAHLGGIHAAPPTVNACGAGYTDDCGK